MRSFLVILAPSAILGPVLVFGWPDAKAASVLLLILLLYLAVFDQKHLRLPDHATLPLALIGGLVIWQVWPSLLPTHLVAACLTLGLLWGLSTFWLRLRGVDALGLGDVKFAGAAALWIGPAVSFAIMLAAAGALLFTIVCMGLGRARLRDPIPFGPFLCFGLWAVWCWFAG